MSAKKPAARRADRSYGDEQLQTLQRNTFRYFWEETNPENGLIPDNTSGDDIPASIAGVGLALASYPVAAERSFVSRAKALERTLATLRVAAARTPLLFVDHSVTAAALSRFGLDGVFVVRLVRVPRATVMKSPPE